MSELTEHDYTAFEKDLQLLLDTMQQSFRAKKIRHFYDDNSNNLFIEIAGLNEFTSEEIEEITAPILDELDLDFDEVLLMPLNNGGD